MATSLNLPVGAMDFLTGCGWGDAAIVPLAGDASFRRYFRLHDGVRTAVLMDAPPATENAGAFVAVAEYLQARGVSAPQVLAADVAQGLVLLEDFGDRLFVPMIAAGADETELYTAACDVLAALHAEPMPAAVGDHPIAPFARERMAREVGLLLDWHWPELCGGPAPDTVRETYTAAWDAVWHHADAHADRIVQFDYHSPNLMWLPERCGLRRVGVLDFQDAMRGPAAYDLVSLLQDPRRDVAPVLEARLVERYLAALPGFDRPAFLASYAVMGAQRAARILGVFVRLWRRDGKTGYLRHMPRVWSLLERNLADPALGPVADWFAGHLPAGRRRDFAGVR
jgi:hypothetical protein